MHIDVENKDLEKDQKDIQSTKTESDPVKNTAEKNSEVEAQEETSKDVAETPDTDSGKESETSEEDTSDTAPIPEAVTEDETEELPQKNEADTKKDTVLKTESEAAKKPEEVSKTDSKEDQGKKGAEEESAAKLNRPAVQDGKSWFVLRVMSGKERKLRDYLENEMKRSNWSHIVSQILVPTEKVYKVNKGKKVTQERNFFPGYILVEADFKKLNGDIIQSIRSVTGVINFLGGNSPSPLRQSEINRILGKVDEMQELGESLNEPFIVGETIKIIDGPFSEFNGNIEEVYDEKKKLKVIVMIFGRKTPVELSFMQVEKHT